MKKFAILLLFFTHLFAAPKTICLNMVVYNDSQTLRSCLESVKPFIDTWAIVDLGSIDSTQAIIADVFQKIPGELKAVPFLDFETHRNEALLLAKTRADYILFLDPNETLLLFKKPVLDKDAYFIQADDFQRMFLVDAHRAWHWEGTVCQGLLSPDAKTFEVLDGIIHQTQRTLAKEICFWESALRKQSSHPRCAFYLALCHQKAQNLSLALQCFQKAVQIDDESEEVFWSWYQMGQLQEQLNLDPREAYQRAHQKRPLRAEPLYRLARVHSRAKDSLAAYWTAQQALSRPLPQDRWVDTWIYEYGAQILFADAAVALGKYAEAVAACEAVLKQKNLPASVSEKVQRNLYSLKNSSH